MLVVMMGLPGTGKSAVAEGVARAIGAPVFSVDPLEATLNRYGITREQKSDYAAYGLAATLARSQLELGQAAVVDAANSIELVRAWWRDLANEFGVARLLIECVCSDPVLHRQRLESRQRNIDGFTELSWADVEVRRDEYEPCTEHRLVLDAARPLDDNVRRAVEYITSTRHNLQPKTYTLPPMNLRTVAAIAAGKAAGAASRMLGRGGGTAIAGLAALRVDPGLVGALTAQAGAGAIAITGTNGKTTTSLMMSRIAVEAGLRPLHNRSGSNLMRGVAAMLVEEATLSGSIPNAARRLAILEVDEATLPEIARTLAPRAIIFTNLFRDQLDRYGEVDTVAASWERALAVPYAPTFAEASGASEGDPVPVIVLNADDPAVAHLGGQYGGRVIYYGIDDATAGGAGDDHASDFRTCLNCGAEIAYTTTFYGHLGHWRCPACGNARPAPDICVTRVALGDEATSMTISLPDGGEIAVTLPLAGLYNAYNALAAAAGAIALGLSTAAITTALDGFSAAFGRQERFTVDGCDVQVLLGKNPTGLNQVLRTIVGVGGAESRREHLRVLFFLSDDIADGRDVSWIWDADYEIVQPQADWALAAGTRAEDLALRLKYAGFGDDVPVERATAAALQRALDATPSGATLYVVPTYTAMLEVRELLAKRGGASKFWEAGS